MLVDKIELLRRKFSRLKCEVLDFELSFECGLVFAKSRHSSEKRKLKKSVQFELSFSFVVFLVKATSIQD